jgi:hypothetical protein
MFLFEWNINKPIKSKPNNFNQIQLENEEKCPVFWPIPYQGYRLFFEALSALLIK